MKRQSRLSALVLALLLALALPARVMAQSYFFFTVVDDSDETVDGASCSIYDSSDAVIILHTTTGLNSSYRGAITSANGGLVHWYTSSSEPVNVKCFGADGSYGEKRNLSRTKSKNYWRKEALRLISRCCSGPISSRAFLKKYA